MQLSRVKIDYDIEQKLKKTFPSLSADVKMLKILLDDYEEAILKNQHIDLNPDLSE